jgi:hypothetical protein
LRQYGYLAGDKAAGFQADQLAKKMVAAPPEEIESVYRDAALRPKVFKAIFATFLGDKVSKAKIRQRALDLKVHPEESDVCVEVYIESLELAKLVSVEGDQIVHASSTPQLTTPEPDATDTSEQEDQEQSENRVGSNAPTTETNPGGEDQAEPNPPGSSAESLQGKDSAQTETEASRQNLGVAPRAIFNVNVTLDSSLDTEKLAKQLEILKKFGAI